MVDPIWVKAVVKALVLPPTGPLLLALFGLALVRRRRRYGLHLATVGVALLLVLSVPMVAGWLSRAVDDAPPLDLEVARSAQALVILGSGKRRDAVEYGGDTLGSRTLERVRYGARIARQTGLPVLVTGGSVYGGETEAKLMRETLEGEFGVPVRWTEIQSRTTHENAAFSAEILREAGIERIVMIAHSVDMARARAEFEHQGFKVIPAPTGLPSRDFGGPMDFLPSMAGLQGSYIAVYEIVALAVRRVSMLL